jgi:flagellar protein FliO/FliZ
VLELSLRIGFSLLVVIALMWGIAKVMRRPLAGRGGDVLSVVTRQQLTRGASVAIVRVAGRALILGVTDQQVTLLAEASMDEIEPPKAATHVHRSPVDLNGFTPNGFDALTSAFGPHDASAAPVSPAPAPQGRFSGSALSPATWAATVKFLRERTVRR